MTLAIIGASGQLGGATLEALLKYDLATPDQIVAITSSQPDSATWQGLAEKGVHVRHGDFEDGPTIQAALKGVEKFFLVSTPCVDLDFNNAPEGQGRERHHKTAIGAARAAGVKHIYYSSLGFQNPSKAGVMQAHIRTEKYLESLQDVKVTIAREGLYNESWPLYFGYYDLKTDERDLVPIAGEGRVCWTAIEDLGLANALIITDPSEAWAGKKFYLSTPPATAKTISEVAKMVSQARGREVKVKVVSFDDHMKYYTEELEMDRASVEWWVGSFLAIADGETVIDDPTLLQLLARRGKQPKSMEETVTGHNDLYDAIHILRSQPQAES